VPTATPQPTATPTPFPTLTPTPTSDAEFELELEEYRRRIRLQQETHPAPTVGESSSEGPVFIGTELEQFRRRIQTAQERQIPAEGSASIGAAPPASTVVPLLPTPEPSKAVKVVITTAGLLLALVVVFAALRSALRQPRPVPTPVGIQRLGGQPWARFGVAIPSGLLLLGIAILALSAFGFVQSSTDLEEMRKRYPRNYFRASDWDTLQLYRSLSAAGFVVGASSVAAGLFFLLQRRPRRRDRR
jgi:hypothetical protein